MRKLFLVYALMWAVLIVLSPNPPAAWATRPTVTVSKTTTERALIYNISFSTAISAASADSAFIFNENSSWFDISSVGSHPSDSLISLECFSPETSRDSVRFTIVWQVSSAASPSVTAGLSPSPDWITAKYDSAVFTYETPGNSVTVSTFNKLARAGQANKMRIIVLENDASKDPTQTITLRLTIPRKRADYLWR